MSGEPRVEDEVIVFPLRVNICLKGLTVEQLRDRRKASLALRALSDTVTDCSPAKGERPFGRPDSVSWFIGQKNRLSAVCLL